MGLEVDGSGGSLWGACLGFRLSPGLTGFRVAVGGYRVYGAYRT